MQLPTYVREVGFSAVFKLVSLVASFLLVPVMLGYVGVERFGIWVTLYSILSWVVFFDLGLASSLRNRVAGCLSADDWALGRIAISSTYLAISLGVIVIFLFFFTVSFFIDWQALFNTSRIASDELWACMVLFAFLFLIHFLLTTVNQLLFATHNASKVVLGQMLSSLAALAAMAALRQWYAPSLVLLAAFYGGSLLLGSLLLTIYFFWTYPRLIPIPNAVSAVEMRGLMGAGSKFFLIQMAVLVIFSTDKFIMAHRFSPSVVAGYEVVSRLFSTLLLGANLLMAPLWSAYTRLWAHKDTTAIRRMLRRSYGILLLVALPGVLLLVFGQRVVAVWVGTELHIHDSLFVASCALVLLRVWTDTFAYLLNGTGMIGVQMWLALLQCVINVPIALHLGQAMGPSGVVWASVITLSLSGVVLPLHAWYLLKEKEGIRYDE